MTYSSEVLADSPRIYYNLDETSGTSAANAGSLGGTGTIGAVITKGETGPSGLGGGTAFYFPASNGTTNSSSVSRASTGQTSAWTFETWFKRDTAYNVTSEVMRHTSSGTSIFIYVTSAGAVQVFSGGSLSANVASTGIEDGSWHHLAVTYSGSTATVYVDGVSKGTGSGTLGSINGTTATLYLGAPDANTQYRFWLDEPAHYNAALSGTRIAAHYAAGTTPASTAITVQAPAQVLNLSAPAPVLAGSISHKTVTVTGVMTLSLSAVNATVSVTYISISVATVDRGMTSGQNTYDDDEVFLNTTTSNKAYFQFPDVSVPSMKRVKTAKLRFNTHQVTSQTISTTVSRVTSAWTESTYSTPTSTSTNSVSKSGVFAGTQEYDVTNIVKTMLTSGVNYGFEIVASGNISSNYITTHESATPSARPQLIVEFEDLPVTPVTVTGPAMTLSIPTRNATVMAQRNMNLPVPAAALTLSTVIPAQVIGKRNINIVAPVSTLSLTFPGGYTKHHLSYATAAEAWLTPVDPYSGVRYPWTINPPVVTVGEVVTGQDSHVNLITNRLSKTTPMSLTLRVPGIYSRNSDRYRNLVVTTLDANDVWYDLEDMAGSTRAKDWALTHPNPIVTTVEDQSGYFFGPQPEFRVEGPQLRKAIHFNGENYLLAGPYQGGGQYEVTSAITSTMDVNVEFSIRTTTQNGTIMQGGGSGVDTGTWNGNWGAPVPNGNKLRIENGKLVLDLGGTTSKLRTGAVIADGEWHHIILNVPSWYYVGTDPKNPSSFIVVDGKPVMVRESFGEGFYFLPHSFMAEGSANLLWTTANGGGYIPQAGVVTNGIVGDLSDVIVRMRISPARFAGPFELPATMTLTKAQQLYYEWSDSRLIQPNAITVNLTTVAPARAKGNVKKMLLLYGLGLSTDYNFGSPGYVHSLWNYYSNAAGIPIPNFGGTYLGADGRVTNDPYWRAIDHAHPLRDGPSAVYFEPIAFQLGEYLVYPVSIVGQGARTNFSGNNPDVDSGVYTSTVSVAGTVDTTQFDNGTDGLFMDNTTGKPRFINLQEDLTTDVTDYDVLSVVNYPWHEFDKNQSNNESPGNTSMTGYGDFPWFMENAGLFGFFMEQIDYQQVRDDFRDSIMEAAYSGVSLWIPEIHAAEHLGFIQAYTIKKPGFWQTSYALPIWAGGSVVAKGGMNLRAAALDTAHGMAAIAGTLGKFGDYHSYMQTNRFRRIVATEPGLTDGNYFEYGEGIEYYAYDEWSTNQGAAYDVVQYPSGLTPGALTFMSMNPYVTGVFSLGGGAYSAFHSNSHELRDFVLSAVPQGIAGKVIAREQEFWYGPGGVRYDNPQKDNVITIAAERGTIVRGRPIRGRAFMEFMDSDTLKESIVINDPEWEGDPGTLGANSSTWHYDDRRRRTVVSLLATIVFIGQGPNGGTVGRTFKKQSSIQIMTTTDGAYISVPTKSMNRRGLDWLEMADSIDPNDARSFAGPIELTLRTPVVGVRQDRKITNQVIGAMRLDLEARDARNYRGNDLRERAFPIILDLQVRGTGKVVKVTNAIVFSLEPMPVLATGFGDRVTVYWDQDTNVTLFLKEDN